MIENTTANQNYPKPNENNSLQDDVAKIENALDMIDSDVHGLNQSITAIGTPPHTAILNAGGVNAAGVTLSSSNNWADFPDLTITFTIPVTTTVMISYHISMRGTGNYLCTRLMVDEVEVTREISGESTFWGISPSCAVELAGGGHTVKIQYRTPEGGVNDPAGNDWHIRLLQVMVMGEVT